jgi:hypothetical protein
MTAANSPADDLNRAIQRVHRSVLVTLAGCGFVVWLTGAADASEMTPRSYAWVAVALGGVAILARPLRSARITRPKLVVGRILVSLLAATGVGLVGVASAVAGGPRTTALAYVLAGAIFSLRPPAHIAPPSVAEAS